MVFTWNQHFLKVAQCKRSKFHWILSEITVCVVTRWRDNKYKFLHNYVISRKLKEIRVLFFCSIENGMQNFMQAQCWILKSRQEHIFFIWMNEKLFQSRENVFVGKKHYSKSSSRNSESIFWLTYLFLFNNVTLFILRGSAQIVCFAENTDLLGF